MCGRFPITDKYFDGEVAVAKQVYRCVAPTLEGFIQQLAVAYVARGYFFYVTGLISGGKDPLAVDQTMLVKFDVARSKWSRYRRKQQTGPDGKPLANTQYIRHERFFVLLCTAGHHKFFEEHQKVERSKKGWIIHRQYADARRTPIVYAGYSVSHRNGHATVRMSQKAYTELKGHFERLALTMGVEALDREFARAPFEPYGGVTRQMFCIFRSTNRLRKKAGLPLISHESVKTRRTSLRPFSVPDFRGCNSMN